MHNGWGRRRWCNGIYPFLHYDSRPHEALGIARGAATVRFGGAQGQEIEVEAGDRRGAAGRHRPSAAFRQRRSAKGPLFALWRVKI